MTSAMFTEYRVKSALFVSGQFPYRDAPEVLDLAVNACLAGG